VKPTNKRVESAAPSPILQVHIKVMAAAIRQTVCDSCCISSYTRSMKSSQQFSQAIHTQLIKNASQCQDEQAFCGLACDLTAVRQAGAQKI
jgi:hypothetical protein